MIAGKLRLVPERCHTRDGIETFYSIDSRDYFVVVAANDDSSQLTHAFGHFVRTGAVANNVTQVDRRISRGSGGKARLQSFHVTVNVAEQQYAQSSPETERLKREAGHGL